MAAKKKKKIAPAPTPGPAKPRRSLAGWESERQRSAATQAAKSRAGRDIGDDSPPVVNPSRRAECAKSFELFCRTYFGETFNLPWSNDHRRAIDRIETAVRDGGLFGYALPRGSGKTSLAESAVCWATLYGHRQFPVVIGADENSAGQLLDSVKSELENNEKLLEDFPEVCYPIRRLEGIAHRANGQLYNGMRTHIEWTAKEIVLPTIPGSAASGAIIKVTGITGGFRGMKHKRPDGKSVRPDLVVIDDPQTDESAKSPTQCADRVRILTGAVLGLAGPGRKIAGVMPCTVIYPGDMADEILDRQRHPEWQGERTKLLYRFPTNEQLWEQYRAHRSNGLRAGDGGKAGTEFYRANREAMDVGAEVSWPARHNPDELSALQHAMNLRFDLGDSAFFAEYQNDPRKPETDELITVTPEQVAKQLNGFERGIVPSEVTRLTAFIDVQGDLLYWVVCGFQDDFTGYVIDYGSFPDQRRSYFTLRDAKHTLKGLLKTSSLEETLRAGLERLTEKLCKQEWVKEDESKIKVSRCAIDANWAQSRDVIYKFCRESVYAGIVIPNHGSFAGATSQPFSEYKPKRGERKGNNWRETLTVDRPIQKRLITDINHWKSFTHERLSVPVGNVASLSIFGSDPNDHRMFADQIAASEDAIKVEAKGRTVVEWKAKPSHPDNHLFDCLVGCYAAAAERGAQLAQTAREAPKPKPRIRASSLQRA